MSGGPNSPIDAVTFDYWNTLCYEPPGGYLRRLRIEAMEGVLTRAKFLHPPSALGDAYDEAWIRYVSCWESNRQFTGVDAAVHVADSMFAQGDLRDELIDAFCSIGSEADLLTVSGIEAVLVALSARGIRVGIICDVGFTPSTVLREHLDVHGLLGYFDHWSFSDEVGAYKPDSRIFEHALAGLGGVEPQRAAHVGDRRRTDIAGATAMGMQAVRVAAVFDDNDAAQGPSGDAVITRYEELLPALGLI